MNVRLLRALPAGVLTAAIVVPSANAQPSPAVSPTAPQASAPAVVALPSEEPAWWERVRSEPPGPAKPIVTVVGGVVAGLGALTMFAASVTWLTAWTESLDVDEHNCPAHRCVEGTRGGDAYESTQDLARATDVLLAVGVPAIATGLSMVIIGASMRGDEGTSYARIDVRPHGAGACLEVTF